MSETEKELLGKKAAIIAMQHNITDVERVRRILEKCKIRVRVRLGPLEFDRYLFYKDTSFTPSLEQALRFLPAEKALELFENSVREELMAKEASAEYLFSGQTLFHTRQELAHLIKKFMGHLIKNKASILNTGRPKTRFDDSPYLHDKLANLYPTANVPSKKDKQFIDRVTRGSNNPEEEIRKGFISFWILYADKKREPLTYFDPEKMFSYEKDPSFYICTEGENQQLGEKRPKLLNTKLKILEIVFQRIRKRAVHEDKHTDFWKECANTISRSLSQQEFRFLDSLDRKYLNMYFLRVVRSNLGSGLLDPIKLPRKIGAGGFKDIMDLIFFVDKELTTGKAHITKTKIMPLLGNKIPKSYYQMVSSPKIDEIDKVLDDWFAMSKEEEFRHSFSERLKDVKSKFKVCLYVSPDKHDLVKRFTQFLESAKRVNIDIMGRFVAPLPSTKEIYPPKLPPGTKWEDITIEFVDGYVVRITAPGFRGRTDYIRMGFENKKTLSPNVQWKFLQELAVSYGEMSWRDMTGMAIRNKKRKQLLSDTLKHYFQIDKDPFLPYKQARKYKTRFHLFPESDEGSGEFTEEPSIYLHQ